MGIHAQVQFLTDSGDLKDAVVNTWDVNTGIVDPLSDAQHQSVVSALDNFYNATPAGQPRAVSAYFSPLLQQASGMIIKTYDIFQTGWTGLMGSPRKTATGSLAAPLSGMIPLPSHMACVLTREASGMAAQAVEVPSGNPAIPATRPRSRYRGRVYLGPFNTGVLGASASGDAAPEATFRSVVLAAYGVLDDAIRAISPNFNLSVWSRSDNALREITAVSMDDRFDVVDRRKRYASTRTRVTVA